MYVDVNTIITVGSLIGALGAIIGVIIAVHRWYLQQNKQDEDIQNLKDEQTIICYGVLAALKGLQEQGCNGPVTDAINKMEKHLNIEAHK